MNVQLYWQTANWAGERAALWTLKGPSAARAAAELLQVLRPHDLDAFRVAAFLTLGRANVGAAMNCLAPIPPRSVA